MKMRAILLGFALFSIFGIVVFSSQGSANSLGTSEVNKIGALKISDSSTKTLIGLNLGTAGDITAITLTFKNSIVDSNTVNISLKNNNDVEIGSGSKVVSPTSTIVTIILSDAITAIERDTLRTARITVTG